MAKNFIQNMKREKGAFTAKAKAAGEGVQEYANEKAGAPGKLGKEARLAKTFGKLAKKRKKKAKKAPKFGAMAGMLGKTFGGGGKMYPS